MSFAVIVVGVIGFAVIAVPETDVHLTKYLLHHRHMFCILLVFLLNFEQDSH
jgi:hypothetical protein